MRSCLESGLGSLGPDGSCVPHGIWNVVESLSDLCTLTPGAEPGGSGGIRRWLERWVGWGWRGNSGDTWVPSVVLEKPGDEGVGIDLAITVRIPKLLAQLLSQFSHLLHNLGTPFDLPESFHLQNSATSDECDLWDGCCCIVETFYH